MADNEEVNRRLSEALVPEIFPDESPPAGISPIPEEAMLEIFREVARENANAEWYALTAADGGPNPSAPLLRGDVSEVAVLVTLPSHAEKTGEPPITLHGTLSLSGEPKRVRRLTSGQSRSDQVGSPLAASDPGDESPGGLHIDWDDIHPEERDAGIPGTLILNVPDWPDGKSLRDVVVVQYVPSAFKTVTASGVWPALSGHISPRKANPLGAKTERVPALLNASTGKDCLLQAASGPLTSPGEVSFEFVDNDQGNRLTARAVVDTTDNIHFVTADVTYRISGNSTRKNGVVKLPHVIRLDSAEGESLIRKGDTRLTPPPGIAGDQITITVRPTTSRDLAAMNRSRRGELLNGNRESVLTTRWTKAGVELTFDWDDEDLLCSDEIAVGLCVVPERTADA